MRVSLIVVCLSLSACVRTWESPNTAADDGVADQVSSDSAADAGSADQGATADADAGVDSRLDADAISDAQVNDADGDVFRADLSLDADATPSPFTYLRGGGGPARVTQTCSAAEGIPIGGTSACPAGLLRGVRVTARSIETTCSTSPANSRAVCGQLGIVPTISTQTQNSLTASANCASGFVVLGGACSCSSGSVIASTPTAAFRGWRCMCDTPTSVALSGVCIPSAMARSLGVATQVNRATATQVSAICPIGTKPVAAGCENENPSARPQLQSIIVDLDSRQVTCTAPVVSLLNATAICAR